MTLQVPESMSPWPYHRSPHRAFQEKSLLAHPLRLSDPSWRANSSNSSRSGKGVFQETCIRVSNWDLRGACHLYIWSDPSYGLGVSRYDNIDKGDLTAIMAVLVGEFVYLSDETKAGREMRCPRADGVELRRTERDWPRNSNSLGTGQLVPMELSDTRTPHGHPRGTRS